jgi:hypothetical protein
MPARSAGLQSSSDENPSNCSTSTIKDDFIVPSKTTSKSDEHSKQRTRRETEDSEKEGRMQQVAVVSNLH